MLGAIAGDIIGSVYEFDNIKTTDFELFTEYSSFTDDTVLTVAVAAAILRNEPIDKMLREFWALYVVGYGNRFDRWARNNLEGPYNSWGNGAAMRISPVAYACDNLVDVLALADKYTSVTHNHPEGIKGAQATAAAVFLARTGSNKKQIREYVERHFGYDLSRTCDNIRPDYKFDESCQGTVPEAIIAFLESTNFEGAIRLAVSLGGDTDTLACITGSIAEGYYGCVPEWIAGESLARLDNTLRGVVEEFSSRYTVPAT